MTRSQSCKHLGEACSRTLSSVFTHCVVLAASGVNLLVHQFAPLNGENNHSAPKQVVERIEPSALSDRVDFRNRGQAEVRVYPNEFTRDLKAGGQDLNCPKLSEDKHHEDCLMDPVA